MAEGKNKITIYRDWIDFFEPLTDEEAGKLIKHFLRYVNDLNPSSDRITELLFEPMKKILKRDLKKWEAVIVDKSQSGKIGNLKRWHIDLYNQVINKQITIEQAELIANGRKPSHNIANAINSSQNVAVIVNDNVIIDKSIIKKKDKELTEKEIYLESKTNWETLVKSQAWFDPLIMKNNTTREFLIERLNEFWVIANYLENPERKQTKDIKLHFGNWLKTNPPKKIAAPLTDNPAPWANFGKDIEI